MRLRMFGSWSQRVGELFVRIGDRYEPHLPQSPYAGHYLPYAIFALQAYDGCNALLSQSRVAMLRSTAQKQFPNFNPILDSWLQGWCLVEESDGPLLVHVRKGAGRPLVGLGYKVFHSQERNEIVIAFRGTDFQNVDDWRSNLRWVTRFFPYYDHYEQVQDHIDSIIESVKPKLEGHVESALRIVATGHSLGGGLAQHAAYKNKAIRPVFAFDPSSVTGYYDKGVKGKSNSEGLDIDRVFQRGEVLAFLRFAMQRLYPVSAANPAIRTSRFSFGSAGNFIAKHNMEELVTGLLIAAGDRQSWLDCSLPLPQASHPSPSPFWIVRLVDWLHR